MTNRPFAPPATILVRAVSPRFDACLRQDAATSVDATAAIAQHERYVGTIERLGVNVEWVEANDAHADGCFVEDTAVVTGQHALLTIPGAASRRAETVEVSPVLSKHCHVHRMEGDARLDGGDVLRAGDTLFVGMSTRTNPAGLETLGRVAAQDGLVTRTVPMTSGLHLKSLCTLLDPSTLLCAPALPAAITEVLRESGCTLLEVPEEAGANVLALGDTVLASSSAPRTVALLRERRVRVVELDVSEIHKADGALTCLSLRIPRAGCWSA